MDEWSDDPELAAEAERLRRQHDEAQRSRPNGRADGPSLWVDDAEWVEADLPRRPWIAKGYALRGAVTVMVGPPSAMKSSLMLAWACAVALGREHGRFRPAAPGSVIIYNVEDDREEQRRRLSAVLRQFNAGPADIAGRVVRVGPAGIGRLFDEASEGGSLTPTAAMQRLRELIAERRPMILIADPLAELHASDENDNNSLRLVIAEFRILAVEFDLAIILVHHTRKGAMAPGDPDSARGASAVIGAARIVLTLTGMAEDDARAFGLPEDRKTRSQFARLDDAKQNYAGIDDPKWIEKVLYTLDNSEAVPAAVPWAPPDLWASIPPVIANIILDDTDAGIDDGRRRHSDAPRVSDRAAWRVVQRHVPSLSESQCRSVIRTWLENGILERRDYHDPVVRKTVSGLYVIKRPGSFH